MNINILTKIFPFLPLFLLLGCPYTGSRVYNETDRIMKTEETVIESTEDTLYNEDKVVEEDENHTLKNRENNIKTIIVRLDSINALLDWKLIKDNLYINNKEELGFQIDYVTEVGRTKNYISHLCDTETPLNKLIDKDSFKHLGSTFYKDKNNIYHYFDMAYGGRFSIYDIADYDTFKVLGDHYAKDKNNIYGERAGKLRNVDYNTFTSEKGAGPYAKDKNGYYFWDKLIMTNKEFYKKFKRKSVSVKEFSKLNQNKMR